MKTASAVGSRAGLDAYVRSCEDVECPRDELKLFSLQACYPPVGGKSLYRGALQVREEAYCSRDNAEDENRDDALDRLWDSSSVHLCVTSGRKVVHTLRLTFPNAHLHSFFERWTDGIWIPESLSLPLTRGASSIRGENFLPFTAGWAALIALRAGYESMSMVLEENYNDALMESFLALGFEPVPGDRLATSDLTNTRSSRLKTIYRRVGGRRMAWNYILCHCGFENPLWVCPMKCVLDKDRIGDYLTQQAKKRIELCQKFEISTSVLEAGLKMQRTPVSRRMYRSDRLRSWRLVLE